MSKIKCAITGTEFSTYYGLWSHHDKIRKWLEKKGLLLQMIQDLVEESKC